MSEIHHQGGAPEPESVKALSRKLAALNNGDLSDPEKVLKIYGDFRWNLKKASMIGDVTYRDIDVMLDAVIKRIEKQIKNETVRAAALLKFTQAKTKLSEFMEDEDMRATICHIHELPFFLCPCPKDPLPEKPGPSPDPGDSGSAKP